MLITDQYTRHVGYRTTNEAMAAYASKDTARFIQAKIDQLLRPDFPQGIHVPLDKIIHLMNMVYEAYRPSTGDPMTRYNIESDENYNCVDEMINQVISIAASRIRTDLQTERYNSTLTVWDSLLGDYNRQSLRAHAPIKLNRRRPPSMQFFSNY